ncbi:hypothetical protein [Prevotella pallens]|nr:hypothetical protein [Prevotella pallens]
MVGLAMPNSRFNKFNLVFLFNQLVMKKKAYITPYHHHYALAVYGSYARQ